MRGIKRYRELILKRAKQTATEEENKEFQVLLARLRAQLDKKEKNR